MTTTNEWFHQRGTLAQGDWESVVDASLPGWAHTGLRVAELDGDGRATLPAGDVERIVIPLTGSFTVDVEDDGTASSIALDGRPSVFDGPADVLYLPVGAAGVVRLTEPNAATADGTGRVAVAEAPATERFPLRRITKAETPVELRGAGRSSRQVHNFGTVAGLDAARFIVCEVITPAENWSSYPAHKHDVEHPGHETALEEIYYFETAVSKGLDAPAGADPIAMFATYTSEAGEIDTNAIVRTGDVALVPFGYHGPVAAAPGYDVYYLNVMAGPGDERAWLIQDDPAHGWVRAGWEGQEIDPRLPYTDDPTTSEGHRP